MHQRGRRSRLIGFGALLGIAISAFVWWVSNQEFDDAVILVALFLAVVGLGAMSVAELRTARRRVEQQLAGHAEKMATFEESISSVQGRLVRMGEQTEAASSRLGNEIRELRNDVGTVPRGIANRVQRKVAHELRRSGAREFAEFEALLELRMLFEPQAPLPPTRGWAASPDILHTLVELVLDRRPALIVECGSGASSVWIGYALRRLGQGRLVSLEHDADYRARTIGYIESHGLTDFVDVRHAELEPWIHMGEEWPWYSLAAVDDLDQVGMVFVDGPPGETRNHARYPALPILLPRCATDAVFVVDDAARDEESEMIDRWLAESPHLKRVRIKHEKGCSLIFTD